MWVFPSFTVRSRFTLLWCRFSCIFQLDGYENSTQSGSVNGYLSSVLVQATCAAVQVQPEITPDDNNDLYNITGALSNACFATSYAPQNNNGTWFGWAVLAPLACVQAINPNETVDSDLLPFFYPVAFSFLKTTSIYSMAFCYSSLEEHTVNAKFSFSLGSNEGVYYVHNNTYTKSLGLAPSGYVFRYDTIKLTCGSAHVFWSAFRFHYWSTHVWLGSWRQSTML